MWRYVNVLYDFPTCYSALFEQLSGDNRKAVESLHVRIDKLRERLAEKENSDNTTHDIDDADERRKSELEKYLY
jgi:hypothetical protein